jgi:hypothetical protein
MATCKLCKRERELRNSHIIPEFMYQNLYGTNQKKFYQSTINLNNEKDSPIKSHQKGIRELLFCDECETLLSKYENYAAEIIYAKNKRSKVKITEEKEGVNQVFLYKYIDFSYNEFKIFLLSILYRVIISSSFYSPPLPEAMVEKLRTAILSEEPLNYDDFGCLMQIILYEKSHPVKGFILDPFVSGGREPGILNIFIDGIMYSFYLNSEDIPQGIKNNFLQTNGEMNVIGRILFNDKGLFERIKKVYDSLKAKFLFN